LTASESARVTPSGAPLVPVSRFHHRFGLRIAAAAIHRRLVEKSEETVVIALAQRIELVVMAAQQLNVSPSQTVPVVSAMSMT